MAATYVWFSINYDIGIWYTCITFQYVKFHLNSNNIIIYLLIENTKKVWSWFSTAHKLGTLKLKIHKHNYLPRVWHSRNARSSKMIRNFGIMKRNICTCIFKATEKVKNLVNFLRKHAIKRMILGFFHFSNNTQNTITFLQ